MGFVNIRDLDVATRDEHSTVDLQAETASRTWPFSGERVAVLAELSSSLVDTWFWGTIDDPEAVFSLDVQTGLLVLDCEEALKEAKGEAVPENAENAFIVAARYTNIELQQLTIWGSNRNLLMAEESSVGMALLLEFQRPVNTEISYDDNGYQMHDMLGLVLLEVVHWPSAGKTLVCVGEKEAKF
jgi:hypothetical protein